MAETPDMRPVPSFMPAFMRKAEARRYRAYRDSAGVLTIGDGHTGLDVHGDSVWTDAECDRACMADLRVASARLAAKVSRAAIDRLTDHQYGALLSFVFNAGAGPWMIWKLVEAGRLGEVPGQLMLFCHAHVNGQLVVVPGLQNRRAAEVALWSTAEVAAAAALATDPSPHQPVAPPSLADRLVGALNRTFGAAA